MTRLCPKCSQPNLPEAAFCHNCASPLSPVPTVGVASGGQAWTPPGGPITGPQSQTAGPGQKAIIALVLAVLALICCGPFSGIPAAIVGWMELGAITRGESPPAGKWMAQVGLWGGIAFTVIHLVIYFIYVILMMISASGGYRY
jgi:hypothetical protein